MTYTNILIHLDNGTQVEISFTVNDTALGVVYELTKCIYDKRDIVKVFEGDIPEGIRCAMEHHAQIMTTVRKYRTINSY